MHTTPAFPSTDLARVIARVPPSLCRMAIRPAGDDRVVLASSSLLPVLIAGMAAKLVFLGLYAAVMLRVLHLQPVPFVASFTVCFVVLHNIEALFMRRLFMSEC